ncbi:cyclase [Mangrovibacterium lignilyticum]|uniref:cyclase n=1 Tax=Mangrovibacterium lignilyticum TaxID=2668052 RepID=UPI0013D872C3|nr:cyclase [Mangrovibacterium lignilyticum]
MITTFVRHAVKDFASWKTVYDDFMPKAKEKGVRAEHVFRDPNAPDQVIVTHQFQSVKDANEFFNSTELKDAMQSAGVSSAPEIWFGEDIKKEVH